MGSVQRRQRHCCAISFHKGVKMDIFRGAERVMGMDDAVWPRHANPWSVWTRIMIPLPLLIAAAFSRIWLGWGALVPIAVVMVWIWLNPRLFAAPRDFRSWAAQGVLGERVFLRKRVGTAAHHRRAAYVLTAISAFGVLPLIWGFYALNIWAALLGTAIVVGAKTWFVDRMVWVWQDFERAGFGIDDLRG